METPPPTTEHTAPTEADVCAFKEQLGRPPRGLRTIAHRCPCGLPDVVETAPRLEDGTPFPTTYYLTCPRAASAIGTLEANGVMREMTARLAEDPRLAAAYRAAHEDYLARRDAIEELKGFPSAGGMPERVKCLHVLVAHSLVAGPGVNPLGDEALAMLPEWWRKGPCVTCAPPDEPPHGRDSTPTGGPGSETAQAAAEPAAAAGGGPIRAAAIDCGTNSIRLLVADIDPATGELTDLDRRMEIVRLGQGVDRTGRLAPEALERTFAACRRYAAAIEELGVAREHLTFAATSASRDAENRDEFVSGVLEILGVEPEVITGEQEAEFSFTGATRELAAPGADVPDAAKPYLVVDIGGGSTEFVVGTDSVTASRSVDIGCVRLTERHLTRDGEVTETPSLAQIQAIRADVESAIDLVEETVPLSDARTLVGLAGTVTTLAGLALDLDSYDPSAIHHSRMTYAQVQELTGRLLAATHDERAALPVMHPGRTDVINAGALVLQTIMERTGAEEIVVSEHDILDGLTFAAAGAR
ncbi:DUF501 domain-containing protein [Streptomyces xiaopingdaonensis]|uniref:DUF501 domain-containing protein n=1 Tax=Streptomyces xiaopingdaonensis TaxID=1565415 RepID=UPI00031BC787|nr:DUF501 domain-containing protein [Streptomyces xiaopingdaonensis]